ncbi:hypothetical protein K440DRAFT_376899 [Wilcoxina mikolae CBS 423.85]|nr:hypothetical protein K440DRAFT_376899 [Wilcoxina mikolae CBS 423.85]
MYIERPVVNRERYRFWTFSLCRLLPPTYRLSSAKYKVCGFSPCYVRHLLSYITIHSISRNQTQKMASSLQFASAFIHGLVCLESEVRVASLQPTVPVPDFESVSGSTEYNKKRWNRKKDSFVWNTMSPSMITFLSSCNEEHLSHLKSFVHNIYPSDTTVPQSNQEAEAEAARLRMKEFHRVRKPCLVLGCGCSFGIIQRWMRWPRASQQPHWSFSPPPPPPTNDPAAVPAAPTTKTKDQSVSRPIGPAQYVARSQLFQRASAHVTAFRSGVAQQLSEIDGYLCELGISVSPRK